MQTHYVPKSQILLAVLKMPIDCWSDTEINKTQRHSVYVEAAERITELEKLCANLITENVELKNRIDELALIRAHLEGRINNGVRVYAWPDGKSSIIAGSNYPDKFLNATLILDGDTTWDTDQT